MGKHWKSKAESMLFDILYDLADQELKRHNPCGFIKGKCNKQRSPLYSNEQCCRYGSRCNHLTPQGCSIKSLGCKLWVCDYIYHTNPKLAKRLDSLKEVAITFLGSQNLGVYVDKKTYLKEVEKYRIRYGD